MLVTRQCETEQNHWSFYKPTPTPRMSTQYDPPLSTQPDWPGSYPSFLPPGDNIYGQSYEHVTNSSDHSQPASLPRSAATEHASHKVNNSNASSPPGHGRNLDPLGLRQRQPSPISIPEQVEPQGDLYSRKAVEYRHEDPVARGEVANLGTTSNTLGSASGGPEHESNLTRPTSNEAQVFKEEEDDMLDDEDMLEGEGDGEGEGGDGTSQPQTAAERTAQRRKMKRFRLTHQQTRFLMSEFAKQPHPDAAHRERLSREIPGLSPRQVQVWFQNRRAKIKRLTADDRDRMIKMRAVPDDFDNVQALHSPYGAVHTLGTPIASPVDFSGSSYAEHMMRPLIVDVRRGDGDDHLSPTGLSPAFGSIGFSPSAPMSSSDMLSPLSPSPSDRYGYPGHLSSPLSAAPRTSNPFTRQGSIDTGMQMHSHHQRQQIRSLQPLQLRETISRSRSDSLQSPLRSSMSWKGDSIDYSTYHSGAGSPHLSGRHQSLYQPDNLSATPTTIASYESGTYAGSTVHSPTHMSYPNFSSSGLQNTNPQNRTGRLRAASATSMQPLSLDLRSPQYRGPGGLTSQSTTAAVSGRTASGSHMGGVSSSPYSSSFPSAPLTAPMDFSLPPRTPTTSAGGYRTAAPTGSASDYSSGPQMSAPIAPPGDFSQAFQASMAAGRTPVRDNFGGAGGTGGSTTLHPIGGGAGSTPAVVTGPPGARGDEYAPHHHHHHAESGVLRRKLSFGAGATAAAGPGYGAAN